MRMRRTRTAVSVSVECLLDLSKDKVGIGTRVQRAVAEQNLHEAQDVDDDEGRDDTGCVARAATEPDHVVGGPGAGIVSLVETVFTYDLFVDNPKWARFTLVTGMQGYKMMLEKYKTACTPWQRWIYSPTRAWIYDTLSHAGCSDLAYWASIFMMATIIINTITFCFETVPHYERPGYASDLYTNMITVDYVCMGIFTLEYMARIVTCPNLWPFLTSFSNTVDLVAIAPFYLELIITGKSAEAFQTRIVRLLRILRIMRLLRVFTRFQNLVVVVETAKASVDVLSMLLLLLLVFLVVFAVIFFYVEAAIFDSIPQAMYYSMITLTTTGYGDITPVTNLGRFVAGVMILICMVVISCPIAVLGGNFAERWTDFKRFQSSIARSRKVWPLRGALHEALIRHEAPLDDLLHQLRLHQVELEEELLRGQAQVAAARAAITRAKTVLQAQGSGASKSFGLLGRFSSVAHARRLMGSRSRPEGSGSLGSSVFSAYSTTPTSACACAQALAGIAAHSQLVPELSPASPLAGAHRPPCRASSERETTTSPAGATAARARWQATIRSVISSNNKTAATPGPGPGPKLPGSANTSRTAASLPRASADGDGGTTEVAGEEAACMHRTTPPSPFGAQPGGAPGTSPLAPATPQGVASNGSGPVPPLPRAPPPLQLQVTLPPLLVTPSQLQPSSPKSRCSHLESAQRLPSQCAGAGGSAALLHHSPSMLMAVVSSLPQGALCAAAAELIRAAGESAKRISEAQHKQRALWLLGHVLQADDVHVKLDKMADASSVLRCWEAQATPLAISMRDVMWGLDGLAEVLEGDLPCKADHLLRQDSAGGEVDLQGKAGGKAAQAAEPGLGQRRRFKELRDQAAVRSQAVALPPVRSGVLLTALVALGQGTAGWMRRNVTPRLRHRGSSGTAADPAITAQPQAGR